MANRKHDTSLCKYFMIGCPRKNESCYFVHDPDNLQIRWCPYKEKCLYDRTKPDRDKKKICYMFHPHEHPTKEDIITRALEFCQPIRPEDVFRNTKLCKRFQVGCSDKNCIDAHNQDDLTVAWCPYSQCCPGDSCTFMHRAVRKSSENWGSDDEELDYSTPIVFEK